MPVDSTTTLTCAHVQYSAVKNIVTIIVISDEVQFKIVHYDQKSAHEGCERQAHCELFNHIPLLCRV